MTQPDDLVRHAAIGMTRRVDLPVYDSNFWANPFDTYEQLRKEFGSIVPIKLPNGVEAWLIIGYESARNALLDQRLSKDSGFADSNWHCSHPTHNKGHSAPVFKHLLTLDAPEHTRLRAVVQKDFTKERVDAMRPRIQELANQLVEKMLRNEKIDLIANFANPLPLRFICDLLGVPTADEPLFRVWSRVLVTPELDEQDSIPDVAAEMRAYLETIARGTCEDSSLFLALSARQKRGEITMDELTSLGFLLLVAGHETTVNLIANGALVALRSASLWRDLAKSPNSAARLSEEFLRLDSPLHWATPRFAREELQIDGTTIEAGRTVFVAIGAANRDYNHFEDPSNPNPNRANLKRHLSFGLGSHFCLGAGLARLEGEIAFQTLSRNFPRMRLAEQFDSLTWRPGPIMRGLAELPVIPDPKP